MQPAPPYRQRLWIALAVGAAVLLAAAAYLLADGRLPRPGEPAYEEYAEAFETGTAALDAGINDVADRELSRAIDLVPEEPAAWANRALAHLRTEHLDEAAADLRHAARLARNNADVEEML